MPRTKYQTTKPQALFFLNSKHVRSIVSKSNLLRKFTTVASKQKYTRCLANSNQCFDCTFLYIYLKVLLLKRISSICYNLLLVLGVFLYYYKNKLLQTSKSPRGSKIEIDMTIDLRIYKLI